MKIFDFTYNDVYVLQVDYLSVIVDIHFGEKREFSPAEISLFQQYARTLDKYHTYKTIYSKLDILVSDKDKIEEWNQLIETTSDEIDRLQLLINNLGADISESVKEGEDFKRYKYEPEEKVEDTPDICCTLYKSEKLKEGLRVTKYVAIYRDDYDIRIQMISDEKPENFGKLKNAVQLYNLYDYYRAMLDKAENILQVLIKYGDYNEDFRHIKNPFSDDLNDIHELFTNYLEMSELEGYEFNFLTTP